MERELIEWLKTRLKTSEDVLIGIGDDAAVLRANGNIVVTTDMLMDGIDFRVAEIDPRRAGRKALAVNLSDLAAMAARPLAAFVSVALPRDGGEKLAKELCAGLAPLADEFRCPLAGGDTNSWDGPLVISVTALGVATARGPLLRSGAAAGNAIVVTGPLGNSIAGHHFDFTPRVREALWLHEHHDLRAGIDISDGLSLDLWRMCEASGCGAILNAEAIPLRAGATLSGALSDGEDFELLLAVAPAEADWLIKTQPCLGTTLSRIGEFVAERGLWLRSADGAVQPLVPRGYEHT